MNADKNPFYVLLGKNYCVNPDCTTCGCLPFRNAVQELGEQQLLSMMELDENTILSFSHGLDAVYLAFCCIPDIAKRNALISHWPNVFRKLSLDKRYMFHGSLLTPVFKEFANEHLGLSDNA